MKPIYLFLLVLLTMSSCKSKKTTPFIDWVYQGVSHSTNLVNVDASAKRFFANEGSNTIRLFTTSFEIGEYTADMAHIYNGGIIGVTINDTTYADTTIGGKIYIQSLKDDKMDGTFAMVTITGNTVTGSFKNIPRH